MDRNDSSVTESQGDAVAGECNTNSDNDEEMKNITRFRITVEVPSFLIMLVVSIAGVPTSNLLMYRACVNALNHSREECASFLAPEEINHTQALEDEVQVYMTGLLTVQSLLQAVMPAVLSLLVGVWSDKHGRKPMIVWPMLGLFVSNALAVVYSLISSLDPWAFIWTVLPFSLSGGYVVFFTGALCYVSDISSTEKRGIRLMLVQVSFTLGSALGSMISPFILKAFGNISYQLLLVTALNALAYSYTVVCLPESLRTATTGSFTTLFKLDHLKEMLTECFKKKPDYRREMSLLAIVAATLSVFTVYGQSPLLYLYVRNKIKWTMKDFTTFASLSTLLWLVGSAIAIGVVQRLLKISDLCLSMVAFLSCMLEHVVKALATTTLHMYLGSAAAFFGNVSSSLLRSFLSKINPGNDTAKAFTLLSSAEAIIPLLAPITYNALYAHTISSFPGAFLILSGSINVVCALIIVFMQYLQWRAERSSAYGLLENET